MKTKLYYRKCPKCKYSIEYTTRDSYMRAKQNDSLCGCCSVEQRVFKNGKKLIKQTRKCKECGRDIHYASLKGFERAMRENCFCLNCGRKRSRTEFQCLHPTGSNEVAVPIKDLVVVGNQELIIEQEFVRLQLVEYSCPHCGIEYKKRLPDFHIHLQQYCESCHRPYLLWD